MRLLILGANSDVAFAVARKFAEMEQADLHLASRDMELLEYRARDIRVRYHVAVATWYFDALDFDSHADFYAKLEPKPDGVLLAFGHLGDQQAAQKDFNQARAVIDANFCGAASILEIIAADFERRGHGVIIGISSVAGQRGRQSNYIYGAAKGALTVYLSGLRNRLHRSGVRVLTVLPGFVRTKMTEHLDLPALLVAEPDEAARDIHRAYKRNKEVIYTKWFWRLIMFLITITPEKLFKRTDL